MKFYTADLHLGHKNILRLCNRPFGTVQEMTDVFVSNWNSKVVAGDDVYVLGDVSFNPQDFFDVMPRLNGVKHIVVGNHDPNGVHNLSINNMLVHKHQILNIKDQGRRVVLCHYPIYEWPDFYKGAVHLHGHTHGNNGVSFRPGAWDVGIDLWNYHPMTLTELIGENYENPSLQKSPVSEVEEES